MACAFPLRFHALQPWMESFRATGFQAQEMGDKVYMQAHESIGASPPRVPHICELDPTRLTDVSARPFVRPSGRTHDGTVDEQLVRASLRMSSPGAL